MMIRRINLIPPSERPRTQTDFGALGVIVISVIVLAVIALSYVYFNGVLTDRKRELAELQAQTSQARAQLAALAEYESLQNKRVAAEDIVQHIYAGRTLLSQTLGDLSLVIPKEVWLQQLALSAPAVPAYGAAGGAPPPGASAESDAGTFTISGSTYTFEDVATMMVRLEQIPSLEEIVLGSAGVGQGGSGGSSGGTAAAKSVKVFSMQAGVTNTQSPDTPLPISQVQVVP